MSLRTQRSLQALILAGLGLFLLQTIWSGTLYWYINQRFMLLILSAAVGLLVMARMVIPGRAEDKSEQHDHHGAGEHHHLHGHENDHQHQHRIPTWSLLIVALPLALGILVPARPLGSSAIANKGINTTAPLSTSGSGPVRLDMAPTDRTVLDWVRAFNYAESTGEFAGQPADVIGFVYHDASLPEGQFLVSRFTVTCCAADASAIGLLVSWPGAAGLQDNGWVRVSGPISAGSYGGRTIPLIEAQLVEGVAAPAQPYLYP